MTNAHKKNVDLYVFIGTLRSWTTYTTQLQRTSPRQLAGAPSLVLVVI